MHKMEEVQRAPAGPHEEMSLLDLLVTVAENLKLLIAGSLLAGVCAWGIAFMLPQTFQSVAVVQAEQSTAALITATPVLDHVILVLGLGEGNAVEEARSKLRGQIKTVVGRNDKLLTLTVSANTPEQAQAIAGALLAQTYQESRPKGSLRQRLETQLAEAQARFRNAQNAGAALLKRLESAGSSSGVVDMATGYAELLNATGAAQKQIGELEAQLEGVSASNLIQAPTKPRKASHPPKGLIAIGATVVTGLLLLLFVFTRQVIRNSADQNVAAKLARIRQSFGLK
jgi:uncharacterized protein involved in exopolysaccharide biosynthesis